MQSLEASLQRHEPLSPRYCRTIVNHGQTPFDAEWMIEVADALIGQGIDRRGGNELLAKIARRLEGEKSAAGYELPNATI